jgi:plasmid stabilization system protein ParE
VNLRFHADALAEYVAAVAWYERDYVGRGERFQVVVEQALAAIARAPRSFPKRLGAYAVLVPRFPYVVFFEVLESETIRILAVAHAKRRPGYWRARE